MDNFDFLSFGFSVFKSACKLHDKRKSLRETEGFFLKGAGEALFIEGFGELLARGVFLVKSPHIYTATGKVGDLESLE